MRFTYSFFLQLFSFYAANDIAVVIKRNEDAATVQLSFKEAGSDEKKRIRRIAGLIRNFIYERTSQEAARPLENLCLQRNVFKDTPKASQKLPACECALLIPHSSMGRQHGHNASFS